MAEEVKTEINNIKALCATRGTQLALMQKNIEDTKEAVNKLDKKFDDFDKKLDTQFERFNRQFAGKWVEKFAVSLVLIFALAALYIIFDTAGLPR